MKIDIHETTMGHCCSSTFYQACKEQLWDLIVENYGTSVKTIQFYTGFYEKGKAYPFVDDMHFFYPLTVIYKNGTWETVWIQWNRDSVPPRTVQKMGSFFAGNRAS